MSLELKVVLLTVALVAYLVFFHISLCSWWDCCGHNLSNLNDTLKPNDTLRWAHLTHCQDPSPSAPSPACVPALRLCPVSCPWDSGVSSGVTAVKPPPPPPQPLPYTPPELSFTVCATRT